MKLLLIDNYDSFTYLLVQYFEELDCSVTVVNDQDKMSQKIRISPDFICENYDAITISPGPKTPKEAVFSRDVVQLYAGKIPMLEFAWVSKSLLNVLGEMLFLVRGQCMEKFLSFVIIVKGFLKDFHKI